MSGGVDSSVTAALLKDEGYRVIGITMQLLPKFEGDNEGTHHPQGDTDSIRDARYTASFLDIPHRVLDMRLHFKALVIDNFSEEYRRGKTPNPCIRCNQFIKFDALLKKADEIGTDYIATGHYARIEYSADEQRYTLKKAVDLKKDQSYFLYTLTQKQLERTLMPLGYYRKSEVREIAEKKGLKVHVKPESQEICFIAGKNYRKFFEFYNPEYLVPGPIMNSRGEVIGSHSGITGYTIGQRRGLGISSSAPLYVTRIDRKNNTITVGSRKDAYHTELRAENINWIIDYSKRQGHSASGAGTPVEPIPVQVKIRSLHQPAEALLFPLEKREVRIRFKDPQWAVTPGQAVVFYDGDCVIGGGVIINAVKC